MLPSVLGCYVRAQEPYESPALVVSDKVLSPSLAKQEGERILMHEIGHSLGLADQYKPLDENIGRNNSDIVYSTPKAQKSAAPVPTQPKADVIYGNCKRTK